MWFGVLVPVFQSNSNVPCPGDKGSRFPQTYQILGAISHKTKSYNILLIKEVEFRNEHCGSVSHSLPRLVGMQS